MQKKLFSSQNLLSNVSRLLSFVFFLSSFVWLCKAFFLGLYPDFSVYYYGSKFYLLGKNPYLFSSIIPAGYSYPPIVLLLFSLFTVMPFQVAENLWVFLNFIFLILSLFFLAKIFEISFFSKTNLILAGLVFLSFPTKFTLGMGQINILVLLLLTTGLLLLKQNRKILSGVFFGAALIIKLFPILLPVYFLLKIEKKILMGICTSLIAATILTIVFVPAKIYSYFITNVVPNFFTSSWKLDYYSQSLSGFIGRTFGTGGAGDILKIIILITIVSLIFYIALSDKKNNTYSDNLKMGAIINASILVNTFSWQHHFVWMIIPFYATFFYVKKIKGGTFYYSLLGVSYILISINFANPKILPVLFQSHVFFGALILFCLNVHLFLKRKIYLK